MSILQQDPADRVRILDVDGTVLEGATVPALDDETLVSMYREMRLIRRFDERAVSLQRQGRMGTYPPLRGQEGAQIGSSYALNPEDWVFPSYRDQGVAYVRGFPLKRILLYWMGDERGNRIPEDMNFFTNAVPIATQIPHATGAAWASKLMDEDRAFIVYFGDGATSEGDFHEGLNFGGVFDVPIVYFCNNNQWAISMPRSGQTAAETIAQKAEAYGFEGVQVDGMDPLAVYKVTREAVEKTTDPAGDELRPTLIEAVQYRFGAHTTADDPTAYRSDEEVEEWKRRDPIPRLESYLLETGRLSQDDVESIDAAINIEVDDAVEEAENEIRPHPDDIFEFVYEEPPGLLREQRDQLRDLRDQYDDTAILED